MNFYSHSSSEQTPRHKRYQARDIDQLPIDPVVLASIKSRIRDKCFFMAAHLYQFAIQKFGGLPELYLGLARVRSEIYEYEQAHAALTDAVRIQPGYAEAHADLGLACITLKDYESGDMHLRMAIALNPRDPAAWGRLSLSLARQGHIEAAISGFRHSIRLDPHGIGLRINLERLLRLQKGEENHER